MPRKPRSILRPEEMEAVIAASDAEWRGVLATALYTGLREGEIFGLLKADVDLAHGVLMVSRSWDAPRTKDGKPRPLVIAPPLVPYLTAAMRSPGEHLFPRADGRMQPRHLRLRKQLSRALVGAGLVIGYEWRCRAWRCGWRERQPGPGVPDVCPRCERATTWAKPIPRAVRPHDLRHSHVTAVLRTSGLAVAQQAAGHSDSRLTSDLYGHLDLTDLAAGILRTFPAGPEGVPPNGPRLRVAGGGSDRGATIRDHASTLPDPKVP